MDFEYGPQENLAEFLEKLETVPWFSQIGRAVTTNHGIEQIFGWSDWPGPENPSIEEVSLQHQALYDEIMDQAGDEKRRLKILWNRIHEITFRTAASKVPYDPEEDAWHAPSAAVWMAAWSAGIIGMLLILGKPLPEELAEQWRWYERGHWPCGKTDDGRLLIY